MKKVYLFSFVVLLIFSLSACGKQDFSQIALKKQAVSDSLKDVKDKVGEEVADVSDTGGFKVIEKEEKEDEEMAEEKLEDTDDKDMEEKESELVKPELSKTLLILDASGSMWGQIDGKSKIEIAREVIKKSVSNFNDEVEIGLMAYGHRRKGDCEDIEILVEPKKGNSSAIASLVDKISPKGMTPMGNSVLKAAESLKYTENKATIILVSDGIETCDVDLCALGKKLEETGVDFTAHVIGFDMSEEESVGLECLASKTGGQFMLAKDADSLGEAIEKAVEASACSKEKLGEATISAPNKISAGAKFDVEWTGPNILGDYVLILPKDSEDWNDHLDTLHADRVNHKMIAPEEEAEFDIVYMAECGVILGRTSFSVISVSAEITDFPAEVSAGAKFSVKWVGENNIGDYLLIMPKGAEDWNEHLETLHANRDSYEMTAPEDIAEYDIVYWTAGDKVLDRKSFSVTPVSAEITDFPVEVPAGSEFKIKWVGENNVGDYVLIMPKGSEDWNDHFGTLHADRDTNKIIAPEEAIEYDIVYWTAGDKILDRKSFSVTPVSAEITDFPAEVLAGTEFSINWTGPLNIGDYIVVLPKDSEAWNDHLDTLYASRDKHEMVAPDKIGKYDIVYWTAGDTILARESIIVNK